MTNIDQFESVFRSADKTQFSFEHIQLRSALVVTDLPRPEADLYGTQARKLLRALEQYGKLECRVLAGDEFCTISDIMRLIDETKASIVCLYRSLKTESNTYPYTLGTIVDVVTQATDIPVMLLPHPENPAGLAAIPENTDRVMAITDHLTGDHHLVSMAAAITQANGTLYLTHVEDEATLKKFVEVISKIPTLNTDAAKDTIQQQLLKEPHDYIESCRTVLAAEGERIQIQEIVTTGNRLRDYQRLIEKNNIDLLVLNTKDEDQLAMHGVAYPLAVELTQTAMLLL